MRKFRWMVVILAIVVVGVVWHGRVAADESCKQVALYWAGIQQDVNGVYPSQSEIEARRELC